MEGADTAARQAEAEARQHLEAAAHFREAVLASWRAHLAATSMGSLEISCEHSATLRSQTAHKDNQVWRPLGPAHSPCERC